MRGRLNMKDVFISHSSIDVDKVKSICKEIANEGLSYWVSFDYKDLKPGASYDTEITKAIDQCEAFVLIASNNSLESAQVHKELLLANERTKKGITIFTIVIDDNFNLEKYHSEWGYILANIQFFKWSDIIAKKQFFESLKEKVSLVYTDEKAEIISIIPMSKWFVGRDDEVRCICDGLEQFGKVCVTGDIGVGKSALLSYFCNSEYIKRFANVIYLNGGSTLGNVMDLILNEDCLKFDSKDYDINKNKLSKYNFAKYKMSLLENSITENTIIIIDGFDYENDELSERILNLKCRMLVSSHNRMPVKKGFKEICIETFKLPDKLVELFEYHYGSKLDINEKNILKNYIERYNYNTSVVVLLSYQMRVCNKKPSDYKNIFEIQNERLLNIEKISCFDEVKKIYDETGKLINFNIYSEKQKTILKTLCILPIDGIDYSIYRDLVTINNEELLTLIDKRIVYLSDDNKIRIDSIIREVIVYKYGINEGEVCIRTLVDCFIKTLDRAFDSTYDENIKKRDIAMAIYYSFPNPNIGNFKLYLILSKYFWVINEMSLSIKIQDMVMKIFENNEEYKNSSEEADAHAQIGFTYYGKGEFEDAKDEFCAATKIYSNKLAMSLSHLALAKMSTGETNVEELKELLETSVRLREKYFPNSQSLATSYHLYAKVLSELNYEIDKAIDMEKKAYKIFSSKEERGINVASALYIFGYLLVLKNADEDTTRQGIKFIEEAKEIRLNKRGDIYHSWMEDIYLKLAKVYIKVGNIDKSIEYFELLKTLRQKKYKGNTNNQKIIDVYKELRELYKIVGDNNKLNECDKFLLLN